VKDENKDLLKVINLENTNPTLNNTLTSQIEGESTNPYQNFIYDREQINHMNIASGTVGSPVSVVSIRRTSAGDSSKNIVIHPKLEN